MITYRVVGALPPVLSATLLRRVAKVIASVRGAVPKGDWDVGIRCVTPRAIQQLNRTYRRKDAPTDVLSFAAADEHARKGESRELGDVVLCTSVATREARRRCIDPAEEMVRLLVHGTLHLAKYDHATAREEERMFALQELIVERVMTKR